MEENINEYPFFEDIHKKKSPLFESNVVSQANTKNQRDFQNVLVYEPSNYNDVQTLIDYLKRKEPAIINLDSVSPETAQRVLDFTSGAIYALNGSVLRLSGNIFLLSPEGVGVTVPHELSVKK